jgi:queuosine precursor transporter
MSTEGRPDPLHTPYAMSVQQKLYVWLAGVSVASLLLSDVIGVKLFHIGDVKHSAGMLTFPITFLLTDLINEYYGKKAARRVTWISLVMGLYAFFVINIALAMPYLEAPFNISEDAFEAVFASSRLMFLASLAAYIAGQLCDIWSFHLIKKFTRGRLLWLRATGSTIISQILDSFVVTYLAFGLGRQIAGDPNLPPVPFATIMEMAAVGYGLKFFMALAVTPILYAGHGVMRKGFGLQPLPAQDPRA